MNKPTKKELKRLEKKETKRLLDVWKEKGKKKWGDKCEVCGSKRCVQYHHFFPKKQYKVLMFDVDNCVPLCRSHHFQLERLKRFDIIYNIIIDRGMKWLKKLYFKL